MAPEHRENEGTDDVQWAIPEQPITLKRPVAVDIDKVIPRPGVWSFSGAVIVQPRLVTGMPLVFGIFAFL